MPYMMEEIKTRREPRTPKGNFEETCTRLLVAVPGFMHARVIQRIEAGMDVTV